MDGQISSLHQHMRNLHPLLIDMIEWAHREAYRTGADRVQCITQI